MALSELLHDHLLPLLRDHGAIVIGGITMVESIGIPAPGESAVIAGALYAATTHEFGIAAGAILGDNIGYLVGRNIGFRLLRRYGRRVGLTYARIKLGRYLFQRHGSKMVFLGRFIAILRTFTAVLAGANRMDWRRFLLANALGGSAWASLYGFGAFLLGQEAPRIMEPLAVILGGLLRS